MMHSAVTTTEVAPAGLKGWLAGQVLSALPFMAAMFRRFRPIPRLGPVYAVTRHDDVLEVFRNHAEFGVPYKQTLDVLTNGEPFFLGMNDTPEYRQGLHAMRAVVRASDPAMLARNTEEQATALVAAAGGRIDVVQLARRVGCDTMAAYLGIPAPAIGRLDVWCARLFGPTPTDTAGRAALDAVAAAFRQHLDDAIAARKAAGAGPDDVLRRCLAAQAEGKPGYSDVEIRTNLLCLMVGGPPQVPMVMANALEQLLRRPDALAAAAAAARADDDALLWPMVREAMRFDPLGPAVPRIALAPSVLARGTARERSIPAGATVVVCFASAMMDERRVPHPARFDHTRSEEQYIHFGHGLHHCFGRRLSEASLHLVLKPLLRRPGLRRAPGAAGRLRKSGIVATRLVVEFG